MVLNKTLFKFTQLTLVTLGLINLIDFILMQNFEPTYPAAAACYQMCNGWKPGTGGLHFTNMNGAGPLMMRLFLSGTPLLTSAFCFTCHQLAKHGVNKAIKEIKRFKTAYTERVEKRYVTSLAFSESPTLSEDTSALIAR